MASRAVTRLAEFRTKECSESPVGAGGPVIGQVSAFQLHAPGRGPQWNLHSSSSSSSFRSRCPPSRSWPSSPRALSPAPAESQVSPAHLEIQIVRKSIGGRISGDDEAPSDPHCFTVNGAFSPISRSLILRSWSFLKRPTLHRVPHVVFAPSPSAGVRLSIWLSVPVVRGPIISTVLPTLVGAAHSDAEGSWP